MSLAKSRSNPLAALIIFSALLITTILTPRPCLGAVFFPAYNPVETPLPVLFPELAEDLVSVDAAARIADEQAARVWSGQMTRGQPFLLYDQDGLPFAYVYPFVLGRDEFPSYERIFQAVETAGAKYPRTDRRFGPALENLIGSVGCVEVAARKSSFPVLVVRHWLHPCFLTFAEALDEAGERLGSAEVSLKYVEYNGPHELYFNFTSPVGELKLHAYALRPPQEMRPLPLVSRQAESCDAIESPIRAFRRKQSWEEVENASPENRADAFEWIDNYALIPVVAWTHWCVPTSWTMTAGYWDHYNPDRGTWAGWGRIIDYWFDHPAVCQNSNITNVPNFMDEIITHEGNCSWSDAGVLGTLNDINGYDFTITEITGTAANDWCWPDIVSEVQSGRPFVWGVGPVDKHAMTAWGYRISGSQKFVVVYNTWGATAAEQTAEYNYDEWSGAPNTDTGVGFLWPGGGTGSDHAVLHSPRGGETLFGPSEISWFVWGSQIAYTRIYFSSDGGTTWNAVHPEWFLPTTVGWNTYQANLNTVTSKGRVKIECFTSYLDYIAGDGSPDHFMVQGKPDLIPITTCKKDSEGNLLIQVKNNGSVEAGPSITRVIFFPDGFMDLLFPSIAPGATAEVPVAAPGSCWNPDCDYQIRVDSEYWVDESDETNNSGQGACIS